MRIIIDKIKQLNKLILEIDGFFYSSTLFMIFFILFFIINIFFFNEKKDLDYNEYVNNKNNINIEQEKNISLNSGVKNELKNTNEKKLDQELLDKKQKYEKIITDLKQKVRKKELELDSATKIKYIYNPVEFEENFLSNSGVNNISKIIFTKIFDEINVNFALELNKNKIDVRGKFVDNTIKLFGVFELPENEILSVFIHELGHYFDINYFEKKVLFDISDTFYNISWKSKNILIEGSNVNDFVSGYAMTNKYEDFAESFTYYILFNDDFRTKMNKSKKLENKYLFFSKYVFRNDEFKKTNFRDEIELKDYYWDTTKIKFSLKDFLDYLKKYNRGIK